ncbi:abl interactor 2-like isoform X2 [Neocloeon triangulifer]|uniref:abl interactor 2-like isoform X2 n=1 Tax=Neocloeon triangulifer TaxID=2078957 RepID=UPI00286F2950|nr:abl interactor 2-like isoform X2 [Neocloeon triangulifer]
MDFDFDLKALELTLESLGDLSGFPPPPDLDEQPDLPPPPPADLDDKPDFPAPPPAIPEDEPDFLPPPPDLAELQPPPLPKSARPTAANPAVGRMMVGARGGSELGSDTEHLAELAALLSTELPEGRASLSDSHQNLQRVAEYCEENYYQSENKRAALEDTKSYTTQSLASVAYQINTLAYNFLQLLELQGSQLADMESQMNHLSQTVMIHKEKVARREIGVLTASKTTNRQFKIIAPANPEKPIKYVRRPIDYNALDNLGHGVHSPAMSHSQQATAIAQGGTPRSKRGSSQGAIVTSAIQGQTVGPPPTTKPPTPPQAIRNMGTLSKGSREYRTPPAVAPPQVPSHYAPNFPMGHPRRSIEQNRGVVGLGPGYSTLPMQPTSQLLTHTLPHPHHTSHHQQNPNPSCTSAPGPPQIGMVHPINHGNQSHNQNHPQTPPPPPPPTSGGPLPSSFPLDTHMSMPPPPSPLVHQGGGVDDLTHHLHMMRGGQGSPPLPPPPMPDSQQLPPSYGYGRSSMGIVPEDAGLPGWVPKNYMEKVVAIYDYYADKEDELSFQENSVIYVLKKNDDGWWEGVMDGITGLFPGNYVEPCV